MAGAGRQGHVDVEAVPLALPALGGLAGVEGVVAVLMQADRQHLGVMQKIASVPLP